MKTFACAYTDDLGNEIKIKKVHAKSKKEAIYIFLAVTSEEFSSIEKLKEHAEANGYKFNAIEI